MTGIAPAEHSEDDAAHIEFCGEWHRIDPEVPFTIGRHADLSIDDNPFLHRHLLEIRRSEGLWLLHNVGSRISVTVTDSQGRLQSWLGSGSILPLVFKSTTIVFTAGSTTYELSLYIDAPAFLETQSRPAPGVTTIGDVSLTLSQRQLILALAEPMLVREGSGMSGLPTAAEGARRLGWTVTRFNRKLDNVCDKLDRLGVKGLRGGRRSYATNRRARLVEYALGARLITRADLGLLDASTSQEGSS